MACNARLCSRVVKAFFTRWSPRSDPAMESREQYLYSRRIPRNMPRHHSGQMTLSEDSTLVVSAVVCIALLFTVLVQERHPKVADLTDEARQAGGHLILNADRRVQIRSGQSTSVDPAFTVISPQDVPSSPRKAPASASTPVVANASSRFLAHRQDSTRMIRPKKPNARYKSSAGITSAEVKMRLIALWHQSLVRRMGLDPQRVSGMH
jgi:hypothetical protein